MNEFNSLFHKGFSPLMHEVGGGAVTPPPPPYSPLLWSLLQSGGNETNDPVLSNPILRRHFDRQEPFSFLFQPGVIIWTQFVINFDLMEDPR